MREASGLGGRSAAPLDVPADELRRRIDAQILIPDDEQADGEARAFRAAAVDRCVAARAALPPDTLVLPGAEHTPGELADLVLRRIGERQPAGAGQAHG